MKIYEKDRNGKKHAYTYSDNHQKETIYGYIHDYCRDHNFLTEEQIEKKIDTSWINIGFAANLDKRKGQVRNLVLISSFAGILIAKSGLAWVYENYFSNGEKTQSMESLKKQVEQNTQSRLEVEELIKYLKSQNGGDHVTK